MNRVGYWCNAIAHYALPAAMWRTGGRRLLLQLTDSELEAIEHRVAHYVRLRPCEHALPTRIGDFKYPFGAKPRHSLYFFDLYEVLSRFDADLRFAYLFGDITHEPDVASFVKSRPIVSGPTNSAVMKLDALRHFRFVNDHRPFRAKSDMLVSRNWVTQEHRRLLLSMYAHHPLCDVGKINCDANEAHPEWVKPFMSVDQQLDYKFISCIEGNDVATNLKWVMSSNSLAVTPKPRYETWYMEGTLVGGVHYVEVRPDYSDLIEKLEYYMTHTDEAEQILANAHDYVSQFRDKRLELATQLLTARAYFEQTGQQV